jgi:hypothetical protein
VWDDEDTIRLTDNAFVVPDHDAGVFVVMGHIAYRVSRDLLRKALGKFSEDSTAASVVEQFIEDYSASALFLHVAIGDVDIAPSREDVMDSHRSIQALERTFQEIAETSTVKVQTAVNAEPNAYAGLIKFEEMRNALKPIKIGRKDITYHGLRLRETQPIDMPALFVTKETRYSRRSSREVERVVLARDYDLQAKHAERVVVVKIKDGEQNAVKRYVKRYLENTDLQAVLLAVDTDAASYGWFTYGGDTGGAKVLSLEEYRAAVKEMLVSDPRTRTEPQYVTGWISGRATPDDPRDLLVDILSWGKDVIIYHQYARADAMTRAALADYTIVVLNAHQSQDALLKRIEKDGSVEVISPAQRDQIVADYVRAQFVVTDAEKEALGAYTWLTDNCFGNITEIERIASAVGGRDAITSRTFNDLIDTIDLARMIAASVDKSRLNEIQTQARHMGLDTEEYLIPFDVEFPNLTDVYPLLESLSRYRAERNENYRADMLAYINAR